ncbi:hypothetical protein [Winogradskyella bathintestinalis]|uniref:Uncharacterized protein n=1 Tax=Winogradskyella bathintestinalis TaxID=3035208 RepID=A0ABT7ZQM3_9FLAO|nr:hypothetical protein [Winogradskyella bathintestinalis]MDN3491269.1 hypothetical protein [Winogradskyella bathintestinalis]
MKTLKITFALATLLLLTVSGVQSEPNLFLEKAEISQPTKIDLLAHGKKTKLKPPTQG